MKRILLDSNVLVALCAPDLPENGPARRALAEILENGDEPVVTLQNLVEFWTVATRPTDARGLGLRIASARWEVERLRAQFDLLPEPPSVAVRWLGLVVAHRLRGVSTHDARIVATMLENWVTNVLTFDAEDFARYPELTVHKPSP